MTFYAPLSWKDYVLSDYNNLFGRIWVTPSNTTFDSRSNKSALFHLPETDLPNFDGITLTRIDNGVPSSWDKYLANKSQVRLTLSGVSGVYGSSIKSRKISMGIAGHTSITIYSDDYTFPLKLPEGNITISATVTDSRDRSVTKSVTITVYPYTAPSIVAHTESRANSDGTANILGDTLSAICTYVYDDQEGLNTCSASLTWCVSGGTPSAPIAIENETAALFGNGSIYPNVAYAITYTVTDFLGSSSTLTAVIDSLRIALEFLSGGEGAAFGRVATNSGELDVDWNLRVRGGLTVEGTPTFQTKISKTQIDGSFFSGNYNDLTNKPVFDTLYSNDGTFNLTLGYTPDYDGAIVLSMYNGAALWRQIICGKDGCFYNSAENISQL
jgi:hypothetical protein